MYFTCVFYMYGMDLYLCCICQCFSIAACPLSKSLEGETDNNEHTQIITHLQLCQVLRRNTATCTLTPRLPLSRGLGTKFTHTHTHTLVPMVQSYRYRVGHLFIFQEDLYHVYKSKKSLSRTGERAWEFLQVPLCHYTLLMSILSMQNWRGFKHVFPPKKNRNFYFSPPKIEIEISKINFLDLGESCEILLSWNVFIFYMKHPPNPHVLPPCQSTLLMNAVNLLSI